MLPAWILAIAGSVVSVAERTLASSRFSTDDVDTTPCGIADVRTFLRKKTHSSFRQLNGTSRVQLLDSRIQREREVLNVTILPALHRHYFSVRAPYDSPCKLYSPVSDLSLVFASYRPKACIQL